MQRAEENSARASTEGKKGELRAQELGDATSGHVRRALYLDGTLQDYVIEVHSVQPKRAKLSFNIIQMVYVCDRVRFPLHMVHTCVSIYTLLWSCVLQKWIIANAQFNVPERADEVLKWPLDTNVNNVVIPRKVF